MPGNSSRWSCRLHLCRPATPTTRLHTARAGPFQCLPAPTLPTLSLLLPQDGEWRRRPAAPPVAEDAGGAVQHQDAGRGRGGRAPHPGALRCAALHDAPWTAAAPALCCYTCSPSIRAAAVFRCSAFRSTRGPPTHAQTHPPSHPPTSCHFLKSPTGHPGGAGVAGAQLPGAGGPAAQAQHAHHPTGPERGAGPRAPAGRHGCVQGQERMPAHVLCVYVRAFVVLQLTALLGRERTLPGSALQPLPGHAIPGCAGSAGGGRFPGTAGPPVPMHHITDLPSHLHALSHLRLPTTHPPTQQSPAQAPRGPARPVC